MEAVKAQSMVKLLIVGVAILFICSIQEVKGGCSKFGHSCFGAHGKRAEPLPYNLSPPEAANFYPGVYRNAEYPSAYNNRIPSNVIDWLMALSKQVDSPRLLKETGEQNSMEK